jgi:hypothetical protein
MVLASVRRHSMLSHAAVVSLSLPLALLLLGVGISGPTTSG